MAKVPLTPDQIEEELQAFIDSIDPDAVCRLASQHYQSEPCRMFRNSTHGSYNVCYFVEFEDGNQWVVRFPVVPSVFNVWDKVQSEVATIRYLDDKTTIPVPRIHAFGRGGAVDDKNPTGYTYIIQSYIPGESLDILAFTSRSLEQRKFLYSQLIGFFVQLRHLEFPCAGSLMPDPDGGTTPIVGPLLSKQLNELQLQNSEVPIQPAKFTNGSDFVYHQYHLLDETYKLPAYKLLYQEAVELETFALEDMKRRLADFIEDHGPFVLTHTDLRPANIIVDENLRIQGIIDWEWANTIPRQFFLPPTWLAGLTPDKVSGGVYSIEYYWFRETLRVAVSRPYRRLAAEWDCGLPTRVDLPLGAVLRHYSYFVKTYYARIFPMFYSASVVEEEVGQFFERDRNNGGHFSRAVQERLRDSEWFTQCVEQSRLASSQRRREREARGEPPNTSVQGTTGLLSAASCPGAAQDAPATY